MGTFDISRINFDKKKHYSSVRMQQGRVLTDDDWNENARIENEIQRQTNTEIIGPFGSPDNGFKIKNLRIDSGLINFDISAGTIYLGGLRLEMDKLESYRLQKDWLQQPALTDGTPVFNEKERYDLVYLEAWQQAVSAIEDGSLFEVALGGPDTTTRVRNMRRVQIASGIGFSSCAEAWKKLVTDWKDANLGRVNREYERIKDVRLKVTFTKTGLPEDLCSPSAAGGYLGAENQAIRVQLVDKDHFTWGFDNASPLYKVTISADGKTVQLITDPKDQYHWPLAGQVAEILPWSAVLSNGEKVAEQMGHLTKVDSSFDPDSGEFTLVDAIPTGFGGDWKSRADKNDLDDQDPAEYFYLRIWNRGDDLSSDAKILVTMGVAQPLGHTGLEITITGDERVSGDFWVIAARPETPNRVVPWELEQGLPPHGVRRFFAPLALIRWTRVRRELKGEIIHDCRKTFRPLTELESCCSFTVGDGLHSHGDFNSIEQALEELPAEGGKICVLPGIHEANVAIINRRQVHISGCSDLSIVRPGIKQAEDPIFHIANSQKVQIENLTLVAAYGKAISLKDVIDAKLPQSEDIEINHNNILAYENAIHIMVDPDKGGNNNISIVHNRIGMIDREGGDVAIFSLADGVLIERNRLIVVPPLKDDGSNEPVDPEDPGGSIFDPCHNRDKFYALNFRLFEFVHIIFIYINWLSNNPLRYTYKTKGGIQIGGSSERVRILENIIAGGRGNGITLGYLPVPENIQIDESEPDYTYLKRGPIVTSYSKESIAEFVEENFLGVLYEISIESNQIFRMGLSGIGVESFFSLRTIGLMISVEGLVIYRNNIQDCVQMIPTEIPDSMLDQAGFGGVALADVYEAVIQENNIENNGVTHTDPICGIFMVHAEKIDISNNQILNNGPKQAGKELQIRKGQRGGIVIKNTFKQLLEQLKEVAGGENALLVFDNTFAVKIHGNIIVQPMGHAIFLFAFGPVSVVGNQLSSQGIDPYNPYSLIAGTVFIFNMGFSKDMMVKLLKPRFKEIANYKAKAAATTDNAALEFFLALLQYLPSGRVMFDDNQVTLDLRSLESTLAVSSQAIVSLDDISYNSNQSECTGFFSAAAKTFDIVLTDAFLVAYSIRSNDNRFQEGFTLAFYSLVSLAYMNTALSNQSTYCLLTYGTLMPHPALFNASNMVLDSTRCRGEYKEIAGRIAVPSKDYYGENTGG